MAGLYDEWKGINSFSLLTCVPCSTLSSLHDRQPVFLNQETADAWLDPSTDISALVTRLQSDQYRESFSSTLQLHPVSKKMTNMEYQVCYLNSTLTLPFLANKPSLYLFLVRLTNSIPRSSSYQKTTITLTSFNLPTYSSTRALTARNPSSLPQVSNQSYP